MIAACCVSGLPLSGLALEPEVSAAVHSDLRYGRADDALGRLHSALADRASDAEAHNLMCRVLLQERLWDDAVAECDRAVKEDTSNSDYHMWLGRAYGEKAGSSSYVQAYRLSQRVRSEFETAVRLSPHNAPALADLGEFCTEAPSILGGGLDKADDVARRLETIDPVRSHQLRGRIAMERKDFAAAESEFKTEVSVARDPAVPWTSLASLYRKQERWDDMMTAIHGAIAADKDHGVASTYVASILIKTGREPQLATRLLQSYLASRSQSEEMPAFEVHARLARLLAQQGDRQGAQRETEAVRSLAKDYRGLP